MTARVTTAAIALVLCVLASGCGGKQDAAHPKELVGEWHFDAVQEMDLAFGGDGKVTVRGPDRMVVLPKFLHRLSKGGGRWEAAAGKLRLIYQDEDAKEIVNEYDYSLGDDGKTLRATGAGQFTMSRK